MFLRIVVVAFSIAFLPGVILFVNSWSPVKFESRESVTESGAPVFNEISYRFGWSTDIWVMRQSHVGDTHDRGTWDRLAIMVDKTQTPKVSRFYQLKPGDINLPSNWKELAIPLKARCFACHVNGPRAIRENAESLTASLSGTSNLKIGFWNLLIRSYQRVESYEGTHFQSGARFRSDLPILSKELKMNSCTGCHSNTGIRGPLTFEHFGTIQFMIRNKLMPPGPYPLAEDDRKTVERMGLESSNL